MLEFIPVGECQQRQTAGGGAARAVGSARATQPRGRRSCGDDGDPDGPATCCRGRPACHRSAERRRSRGAQHLHQPLHRAGRAAAPHPRCRPPGPGGCREGPGGTEVAGPERAAWRVGLIPPPNAPVAAGRQPAAVGGKQSAPKPRGQQRGAGSPRAVPRDGARPEGLQHRALPGLAAVPGGVGAELVPTGSGQGRTRAASPTATAKRPAMLGGRAGRM